MQLIKEPPSTQVAPGTISLPPLYYIEEMAKILLIKKKIL